MMQSLDILVALFLSNIDNITKMIACHLKYDLFTPPHDNMTLISDHITLNYLISWLV